MTVTLYQVVFEDAYYFVVEKPAGIATTSPSGTSLVTLVKAHEKAAARWHPSSRLDKEVTGLVTFAKNRLANKTLLFDLAWYLWGLDDGGGEGWRLKGDLLLTKN